MDAQGTTHAPLWGVRWPLGVGPDVFVFVGRAFWCSFSPLVRAPPLEMPQMMKSLTWTWMGSWVFQWFRGSCLNEGYNMGILLEIFIGFARPPEGPVTWLQRCNKLTLEWNRSLVMVYFFLIGYMADF